MTRESRLMAGIIFLTVPSIIYGGYFLLRVLSGQERNLQLTAFQQAMFRAGHAHAGVLVILSLVALLYVDLVSLSAGWKWFTRISFPLAAILVSGGFFASAIGQERTAPNRYIVILYAGVAVLVAGLVTIGIALVRNPDNQD